MRLKRASVSRVARGASFVAGSVCWVAVSSTDPAGSRKFYPRLFGWTYQTDSPGGRGQEITAWSGGRPVAGLAAVPTQAGQATWTLYLVSTTVMHTTQVLHALGGRVLRGPAEVPRRGRIIIGLDPTGARIGFCQPARSGMLARTGPGSLYWAQLDTWNGRRSDAFYAQLFGYQQHQIGDGIDLDYTTWSRHGHPVNGTRIGRSAWTTRRWWPGMASKLSRRKPASPMVTNSPIHNARSANQLPVTGASSAGCCESPHGVFRRAALAQTLDNSMQRCRRH